MEPTATPPRERTIYDVTAPLGPGLVTWPGVTERFEREETASLARGDPMTVSRLQMGAHAGTHIDAPCHFLVDGGGVETVPLSSLLGPAHVVEIPASRSTISAAVLDGLDIPPSATRILAKTANSGWSRRPSAFDAAYVAFDETAAAWCIRRGVVLLGIDYLSIEAFDAGERNYPVHKALLAEGVVVLESLDLEDVPPGEYELAVLPLLIPGSDGAPARAILTGAPAGGR